ncbi:MAG: hypothetical protein M1830_004553, partial [Pleopsidium flavum]
MGCTPSKPKPSLYHEHNHPYLPWSQAFRSGENLYRTQSENVRLWHTPFAPEGRRGMSMREGGSRWGEVEADGWRGGHERGGGRWGERYSSRGGRTSLGDGRGRSTTKGWQTSRRREKVASFKVSGGASGGERLRSG